MMTTASLYLTADTIGGWTGGNKVTFYEVHALRQFSGHRKEPSIVRGRELLQDHLTHYEDPWMWDDATCKMLDDWGKLENRSFLNVCHIYAGTFSKTVKLLREKGTKVCYSCAAHDKDASRREHETLGVPYNYPHLTDPDLWKRYLEGYLNADVVVCPSTHSKSVLESYGCERVEIIPHGVNIPEGTKPLPKSFRVGYLGNAGAPDKGLRYLLEAWKRLDYKDAILVIAGQDSTSNWVKRLTNEFGGGNIELRGFVKNVSDFFNDIKLYIQPSCTEGWGLEVTEAAAHNRPVLCSEGAGAADAVPIDCRFPACNSDALAAKIDWARTTAEPYKYDWPDIAKEYEWPKIQQRYIDLWQRLLA